MIAEIELDDRRLQFDLTRACRIAVPTDPHGAHPRFFSTEAAAAEPLRVGGFTGRVSAGASCNAELVRFAPHCHGTHTEGPGHLSDEIMPVQDLVPAYPLPACLISVTPVDPAHARERPPHPAAGALIESGSLDLYGHEPALVIRTLPNDPDKALRDWNRAPPYPVLSLEAIRKLVDRGVEHLLIDTPSLDPAADGGKMAIHRAFWDMPGIHPGRARCTITEMIYVPDELRDGIYLLSLNISSLVGEASPSAPVLYPLAESGHLE